jgi:hypothetical protein
VNDDIECEFGLNCFKPPPKVWSNFFIPGCSGYNFNRDNFCTVPAGTIVIERDGALAKRLLGNVKVLYLG